MPGLTPSPTIQSPTEESPTLLTVDPDVGVGSVQAGIASSFFNSELTVTLTLTLTLIASFVNSEAGVKAPRSLFPAPLTGFSPSEVRGTNPNI